MPDREVAREGVPQVRPLPAAPSHSLAATVSVNDQAAPQVRAAVEVDLGLFEQPEPIPAPPVQEPENRYLDVPFEEKDQAKGLGARWDPAVKRWFIPPGKDPAIFERWAQTRDDSEIHKMAALARAADSYRMQFYNGLNGLWDKVRIATEGLHDVGVDLQAEDPKLASRIRNYYAKKFEDFSYSLEYPYFQEAAYGRNSSPDQHSLARAMKNISKLGLSASEQSFRDHLDQRQFHFKHRLLTEHEKAIKSLEAFIEREPGLRERLAPHVLSLKAVHAEIPLAVKAAVRGTDLWELAHPTEG